jgi:hypothetical protein
MAKWPSKWLFIRRSRETSSLSEESRDSSSSVNSHAVLRRLGKPILSNCLLSRFPHPVNGSGRVVEVHQGPVGKVPFQIPHVPPNVSVAEVDRLGAGFSDQGPDDVGPRGSVKVSWNVLVRSTEPPEGVKRQAVARLEQFPAPGRPEQRGRSHPHRVSAKDPFPSDPRSI